MLCHVLLCLFSVPWKTLLSTYCRSTAEGRNEGGEGGGPGCLVYNGRTLRLRVLFVYSLRRIKESVFHACITFCCVVSGCLWKKSDRCWLPKEMVKKLQSYIPNGRVCPPPPPSPAGSVK